MKNNYEDNIMRDEIIALVKEADNDNFRATVNESLIETRKKIAKKGKVIFLRSTITSLAAMLLLFVLVYNPVQKYKINKYLEQSSEALTMPVIDLNTNLRGQASDTAITSTMQIKFIKHEKFVGHYFVKNTVIYLPSDMKNCRLFRRINTEGIDAYFIEADAPKQTFKIDLKKENKIMKLELANIN
jgi:hypothetical protein